MIDELELIGDELFFRGFKVGTLTEAHAPWSVFQEFKGLIDGEGEQRFTEDEIDELKKLILSRVERSS